MKWVPRIPWSEFEIEVTRSQGPGGQNVNKTNSAVILRWRVAETCALTPEQKDRLLQKLATKLTSGGEILVRSQESRDQEMNRKLCFQKLEELIEKSLFQHRPRKKQGLRVRHKDNACKQNVSAQRLRKTEAGLQTLRNK